MQIVTAISSFSINWVGLRIQGYTEDKRKRKTARRLQKALSILRSQPFVNTRDSLSTYALVSFWLHRPKLNDSAFPQICRAGAPRVDWV